jgi:hypothetical protein
MVNGTMKLQCTTKLTPGTNKTMTVCVNATTVALKATTPALKTVTLTVKVVNPAVAVKTTAPPSKMDMVTAHEMTAADAHMHH